MFDEILKKLVERLEKAFVVMSPLPRPVPYDAKTGVHLFVGSPRPEPTSGAGRYGYKVRRTIHALVVTESYHDPGNRSEVAVTQHLQKETEVIDAAMDFFKPPHDLTGGFVLCRWVAGDEMMRYVRLNPALCGSVLEFEILYSQSFSHLVT